MITNNGAKMFKGLLKYNNVETLISFQGNEEIVDFTRGNIQWSESSFALAVTRDTQEPTYEDYDCTEITSTEIHKGDRLLSFTVRNCPIITRTFTNISDHNITITGLALYLRDNDRVFVVGKKLLDVPRTFAPNETVTFSYVIEFN